MSGVWLSFQTLSHDDERDPVLHVRSVIDDDDGDDSGWDFNTLLGFLATPGNDLIEESRSFCWWWWWPLYLVLASMTDCGETLSAVEIDVGEVSVSPPLPLLLVSEDVGSSWPFSDDLDCALVTGVDKVSAGAFVT